MKNNNNMKNILSALIMAAVLTPLSSQAATEDPSDLIGVWTGKYTVSPTPDCKIAAPITDQATLVISKVADSYKVQEGTMQLNNFPVIATTGDYLPDYSQPQSIRNSGFDPNLHYMGIVYNHAEVMNGIWDTKYMTFQNYYPYIGGVCEVSVSIAKN